MECIPPRHQKGTRGTAERGSVAPLEAGAAFRQGIDVRCLEIIRAITADIAGAEIIGKNENNVWFLRRIAERAGLGNDPRKKKKGDERTETF